MADQASPLAQCQPARGLSHRPCGLLLQYHAWPETYAQVAESLAAHCGVPEAPHPSKAASGAGASLLRVHPQRVWLASEHGFVGNCPRIGPDIGAVLDLTHARTIIHINGRLAVPLLSRFIAMNLRPDRFAVDDVALTPLHRVSVLLWKRREGFDILAPRSFARSVWEVLAETAERLA